jgi:hypothetical protein
VRVRFAAVALAIAVTAGSAAEAQAPGLIPIPYRTYIAINPIGIPADLGSAEIESAIASGVTIGGLASYMAASDDRWTTGDVKLRYYPGEVVLRGFSTGLSLGATRKSVVGQGGTRTALDFPTFGALVDYNWMLGARKRFLVGTGFGVKRVLAKVEDRERVGLDRAYVTARFVVGVAF